MVRLDLFFKSIMKVMKMMKVSRMKNFISNYVIHYLVVVENSF
jgi:hypothetical protein